MSATEQIPPGVGPLCRERRKQAGVSLGEMAKIVHRDPSSLSRFETGKTAPRGIEQLVRAYTELPGPRPEPREQTQGIPPVRKWPLVFLGLSMVGLLTFIAIGQGPLHDARAVRAWVILAVLAVTPPLVTKAWRAYKRNPIYAIHGVAYLLALYSTSARGLIHWDEPIHPVTLLIAMPAVMLAVLALAFNETRPVAGRP